MRGPRVHYSLVVLALIVLTVFASLGLMTVVFGIGQVIGPYVAGRIADAAHSFSPAFLLAGLVALLLGAGGAFLLPPHARAGA